MSDADDHALPSLMWVISFCLRSNILLSASAVSSLAKDASVTPRRLAAVSASFHNGRSGVAGSTSQAMRGGRGERSSRNSTYLPTISGDGSEVSPVTLPPGRASEAIWPRPTGSLPYTMTIGTVVVTCLATSMKVFGPVTMTSTFRRTNSAAVLVRGSVTAPTEGISKRIFLPSHVAELTKAFFKGCEVRWRNGKEADAMNLWRRLRLGGARRGEKRP